ncbi:uncharacterized protein PAC_02112 [Phialocephala subalpina]|uniref:Uncharacterized protein n=1 Tax=Phialocephala subalpina TaxID=576137 RepID=A0A1L7WHJ4_9HELO|nr:uncharacterized protein PAC_02112 [Phialocephala subalpina]
MPPRRKSAPAGRVYKSATPLLQTKLTGQKKRIKSYGKHTTRRAKEDSTLTQIGFIKLKDRPEEDEEQEGEGADEEESDYEVASKKRKTKRRRTSGDKPSATPAEEEESDYEEASKKSKIKRSRTTGDKQSVTPQWHTQTITQLDWSFSTNEDAGEDVEENVEQERDIFDVPSSSQSVHLPTNVRRLSGHIKAGPSRREESPIIESMEEELPDLDNMRAESPILDMPPPPTPRREIRLEIPSSQSPATPLSVHRGSARQHSPLREKSINANAIPFDLNRRLQSGPDKLPKLEIEDTFDSGNSTSQARDVPSSPDKRPSPAKSVRFALPEEDEEIETLASPSIKKESTQTSTQQRNSGRPVKSEILDSDEEDEEDWDGAEVSLKAEASQAETSANASQEHDDEPETFYGDIGLETQFELVKSTSDSAGNGESVDGGEAETTASGETQIGETQRVSTQHVAVMKPRTENSDIFISIHPKHVTNIVNRTKNHEFRTWKFPDKVCRVWIYETVPIRALKYMAEISSAKKPGEILNEGGIGNAAFNAKPPESSNYAYEILRLYELADVMPINELKSKGWLKAGPQKMAWVRPVVLDELVANLKPPLFDNDNTAEEAPASSSTDTQEVEEQLLSTISQFTQPAQPSELASSQAVAVKTEAETIPPPSSMPRHETPRRASSPPHPSQASTVDLTQATPQLPSQEVEGEIIWESPARPVASSTPMRLPTPRAGGSEHHGPDAILPYSMSSSQFLSRSQLLPDSLLNEDVPGPPRFIHDSDSEDDEL